MQRGFLIICLPLCFFPTHNKGLPTVFPFCVDFFILILNFIYEKPTFLIDTPVRSPDLSIGNERHDDWELNKRSDSRMRKRKKIETHFASHHPRANRHIFDKYHTHYSLTWTKNNTFIPKFALFVFANIWIGHTKCSMRQHNQECLKQRRLWEDGKALETPMTSNDWSFLVLRMQGTRGRQWDGEREKRRISVHWVHNLCGGYVIHPLTNT